MAFTSKLSQKLTQSERAQGLVELAVIAPILIFMFIGLFEVGYALWGYMTLLNVDREATRFSIRPGALNFATYNVDDIGYSKIITHALASNANQLKLQTYLHNTGADKPKAAIIISHFVIDTQRPCDDKEETSSPNDDQCWADVPPDCSDATLGATQYTPDDLVLHPEMPGYAHLRYKYPETTAFVSRLDAGAVADELKLANNRFNCNLLSKNPLAVPSTNSAIVVEMFYQQPQLLDFPLMSWILNPVPLYVQTTMRIDSDDRGRCEVYPIAMHTSTLTGWTEGGSTVKNIWNGAGDTNPATGNKYDPQGTSSERGWINWNDDASSDYLTEMLKNPAWLPMTTPTPSIPATTF